MQPLRLAVASRCWKLPFADLLTAVQSLDVAGLQLDLRNEYPPDSLTESGRRDFLHRLRERGLELASGWIPLRHPLYDQATMEPRLAFLRQAMNFAAQLKIRTLCFRIGRIPESLDEGPGQILREVLNDLATHGNHVGVVLAITPTVESPAAVRSLLSHIKTGPVGIDFDPAHCAMMGLSVPDALREVHDSVVHLQLRDGLRDLAGGGAEVPVGQGVVDWAEVIALLGEMDYRGWVTALRSQGDDQPGDIARGLRHVRRILLGT